MAETLLRKEVTLPNADIASLEEKSDHTLDLSINHGGVVITTNLTISQFDHMQREFSAVRQSASAAAQA